MGPTLIFDKSTLEALNPDEALWLDHFFITNITPLFFVETLADLTKSMRSGRTPEQIVGNLAYKTPVTGSFPNVHHARLVEGELSGVASVRMRPRRPIIGQGDSVVLDGKAGIILRQTTEQQAFDRWQEGKFLDIERQIAKKWRQDLAATNHEQNYTLFKSMFMADKKPKTLTEVKDLVDEILGRPDQSELFRLGMSLQDISASAQEPILARWRLAGCPRIQDFAPYFAHIFSVDLFFNLGIAADLVSRERASHKVDFAYLYYLPFCSVFTSGDNLHANVVPLFLSDDQSFVSASELKVGLGKIDEYYSSFPEDVKREGIIKFAHYPLEDDTYLVTRLWDKHVPSWRRVHSSPAPDIRDQKIQKDAVAQIKRFEEQSVVIDPSKPHDFGEAQLLLVKRMVPRTKGKWTLIPPDVH